MISLESDMSLGKESFSLLPLDASVRNRAFVTV